MHTPDNPYVLYVRPTEVEHHKKLVADWIAARGGVAVGVRFKGWRRGSGGLLERC